MLHQLRTHTRVSKVLCLVRGADAHAVYERVNKALSERELRPLGSSSDVAEVIVLQAGPRDSNLGLTEQTYNQMAQEATIIMHLAWSVNSRMKLQSFAKDSVSSVQNLINLALAGCHSSCPRFVFCSSVASVMAHVGPALLKVPKKTGVDLIPKCHLISVVLATK